MTEDENELLFDGDLFNSQLSGSVIIVKKK